MGLWEFLKQRIWTLGAITALVNGGLLRTPAAFERKHESGKYIVVHELMTLYDARVSKPFRDQRDRFLCGGMRLSPPHRLYLSHPRHFVVQCHRDGIETSQ